jgi:O-antigen/teichoic acid export membrane protein
VASLTSSETPLCASTRARDYWSRGLPWATKWSLALLDQGLTSGSNFLLAILLARWLTAAEYGAYALAFSVFLLLASVNGSLITEPMMVFGPSSYQSFKREYLGSLLRIQGLIGIAFSILLALAALITDHVGSTRVLASTLAGLSVSTPCVLILYVARYANYLEQRPGRAAAGALLYCMLTLGATFAVYKRGILSPFIAFDIIGTSSILTAIFMLLRFKPILRLSANMSPKRVWAEHWSYGRWSLGSAALMWVPANITYSITGAFLGMADTGALKALLNLLLPLSNGLSSFSMLFQPYVSGVFARGGERSTRTPTAAVTMLYIAAGTIYTVLLVLFKHPVFRLLYRGNFLDVAYLVPIAGAGTALTLGSYGAVMGLRAIQRPSLVFAANCAASVVSVVAGIVGTWKFGLRGLVGSMVLSGLTMLLVTAQLFNRRTRSA